MRSVQGSPFVSQYRCRETSYIIAVHDETSLWSITRKCRLAILRHPCGHARDPTVSLRMIPQSPIGCIDRYGTIEIPHVNFPKLAGYKYPYRLCRVKCKQCSCVAVLGTTGSRSDVTQPIKWRRSLLQQEVARNLSSL